MGLANLKKKDAAMGRKPKPKILKVNKYESQQMALNLIAHIMTSSADMSVEDDFNKWDDYYKSFEQRFRDQSNLEDDEYHDSFVESSIDNIVYRLRFPSLLLPEKLEKTNGRKSITVAACGGYSSGKSSFLNNLLNTGNALPTGIEPVSMVNTYINCGSDFKRMSVKGRNVKDELVSLNREVLDCIQHSSKSKVYVASVLKTLYIDLPVFNERRFLDGLTFIDTPGYNNSEAANNENGKTDKDTAIEAMKNADAIIWCIDTEAGTISKNDIDILNDAIGENADTPYVIVFTKMDKKPVDEFIGILKAADNVCHNSMREQPVDILGYSCVDKNHNVVSLKSWLGLGRRALDVAPQQILQSTFERLKKNTEDFNTIDFWNEEIKSYFNDEIRDMQDQKKRLEDLRMQYANEKDKAFREDTDGKETTESLLENLKDLILDDYDNQRNLQTVLDDELTKVCNELQQALKREDEWEDKASMWSDSSSVSRRANQAAERYAKLIEQINNTEWPQYWEEEARKNFYDAIEERFNLLDEYMSDSESANDNYKDVVKLKKVCRNYYEFLRKEYIQAKAIFHECCEKAMNDINNRLRQMQNIEEAPEVDVFTAIAGDNTEQFLECFSDGVDITKCNNQGFSPLTFIARCSNNAMMKFLIDQDVDLSLKDERGYNALETAAIYHCRDICEMLIDHDKGLVDDSKPLAELANNDKFEQWIAKF
uniref:dynamin family protein n=1 Tax=Prevotella sp. TaxID=59823 RepID=UPI0040273E91